MSQDSSSRIYTSKIIKAGALLADTKTLLAHWDESVSVSENLNRCRRDNLFGKASRSRVEDILRIFRQRYLQDEGTVRALVTLTKGGLAPEALDPILYYYAAQADLLLHDAVIEVLLPFHATGRYDIALSDMEAAVRRWVTGGRTTTHWSDYVIRRVAWGVLATLRDFGVLQGKVDKELSPMYLPVESFAYIALCRHREQPSGDRLLADPEWRLFFLSREAVERFFMEAHQRHLLNYEAAGSIIRVTFPTEAIEEYAYAITARTY